MDYIYLRVGKVRSGGGGGGKEGYKLQGQFDFFARGGYGGWEQILAKKKGGGGQDKL